MIGTTLGNYRIVEKLGEGGMGAVYKAFDSRLDRFVAIKVLSAHAAGSSAERRLRFIQEAKAASALNHPNIVTIYDIENSSEPVYIVMEYIEGRTIEQAIIRRSLTWNLALRYAVQIADALAVAHEAGIIHRDIKPANLMVTEQGRVKVLDFGLAKLIDPGFHSGSDEFGSTTVAFPAAAQTDEGVVMGTVAYMSPEQAQGKPLDGRTDIFSFGAVLYEMVTNRRAFHGENKISSLAATLNKDPVPPSSIVEGLPRDVERIIALCLRKDPARRFQHMGDLKIALEDLQQESDSGRLVTQSHAPAPAATVPRPSRKRAMAAAAALALLVAMGLYWKFFWQRAAEDPRAAGRLSLLVSSEGDTFDPALSPDGKMIAYAAREGEQVDLFVSRVAGGSRVRLTNDAAREGTPAFSPDGERLAFARTASGGRTSEIWIIPALGGQATRVVADAVDPCWSPDGSRLAFVLVPPGEPAVLATAAADGSDVRKIMRGEGDYPFIRNPSWSPDGAALAVVRSSGGISGELWLVPLAGGSPKRVSSDLPGVFSNQPVFTPDGRGIVHQSNRAGATNLWLASASGGPLLRLTTGAGPDESPSVGRDGSIAFINRHTRCSLDVRDLAAGKSREIASHGWYIWAPAFSPDGSEVAFSRAEKDGAWHIWIAPLNGGSPRRLSAGALPEIYPRYTPDGEFVVYHTWSAGADRVWRIPHNGGPPEPLTPARNDDDGYADVSPDGRSIAFARTEKQRTRIYIAPIGGGDARLLVDTASTLPRWSPDGRWLAFSPSRQAFSSGIFVVGADGAGLRRVSESGGWPVWWPDGKRIGFQDLAPDGSTQVSTVAVEGGPVQHIAGVRISGTNNPFDISRDGRLLATSGCVDVSSEIWLLQTHPRRPLQ